jgi:hypothetical protein
LQLSFVFLKHRNVLKERTDLQLCL